MIGIRKADERGDVQIDWLKSKHTFSFGHYFDQRFMGFGPLRVINEDRITPGAGFPPHGHDNMEILSYVISGGLEHKDNKGNHSIIRPGDVQRMTAGTGISHSEYNASQEELAHFLQIWIIPEERGLQPGYEQIAFSDEDKTNQLKLVGSRDGRGGSVTIHQDMSLYASLLDAGSELTHPVGKDRKIWIQVVKGSIEVNGESAGTGDGVAAAELDSLTIKGIEDAEILLFDLP